jgi:hypothetical protein
MGITVPRRQQGVVPTAPLPGVRAPFEEFAPPQPVDLGPFTRQVADIVAKEKQKADDVAVLNAENQLSELSTGLRGEALKHQGEDAFNALPSVQDKWKEKTSEIESSLGNDTQKLRFRHIEADRWANLHESIARYTDSELEKHDAEVFATNVKDRFNDAVANYTDPVAVAHAVEDTRDVLTKRAEHEGWGPEILKQKTDEAVSQIHSGVIARMIASGADLTAKAYYTKVKAEVTGEDATQIDRALEVASTEGEGFRLADKVWKELGPKALNDPVRIQTMEQAIRDQQTDPKIVKAAVQELRSRATAQNAEQVEVTATNKASILGAFAKGASVTELVRTPAYLALSGTEQEQLKSYMLNSQYSAANRELTFDAREDSIKAKRGFAAYWTYSEPAKLAAMSENQILALEPTLGRTLVGNLMSQKRAMDKKEGLLPVTLDNDEFNQIANDAGLNPYGTKLGEDEKAALGNLKVRVKNAIDVAQVTKGKPLTRDEERAITQSIVDQRVMIDRFGRDDDKLAATVTRDQRGDAYIPIAQVPPQVRTEAINWLRSNGLVLPNENDAKAMVRFQRRIEKAYAARVIGAGATEIDQILRGLR